MRKKQLITPFFVLIMLLPAYCLAAELKANIKPIKLGDTTVKLITYSGKQPGLTYFHPHQDETTALKAAKMVIAQRGGKVVTIAHGGQRLITFYIGKDKYIVDPNRIFTDVGIKHTLRLYSHYSPAAFNTVNQFAKTIVGLLSKKFIVAVHNNTIGHYSALSYKRSHKLANDALKRYFDPKLNPNDFLYMTTMQLYKSLMPYKFNMILQDDKTVTNDGSFSVYAPEHNIPYINIEAEYGHLKQQLAMLSAVHTVATKQ